LKEKLIVIVKIDFNENDITATFTVLEKRILLFSLSKSEFSLRLLILFNFIKASFYGPVDPKPIDLSLANATLLLNVSVSAGKFPVTFAVSDTEVSKFRGSKG
jgi:hypothetical protein